jgi:hypothetical protein
MPGITINPALMSNAAGGFFTSSDGYVQGTALDSPTARFGLIAGFVAPAQQSPLWGGMAVKDSLPAAGVEAQAMGHGLVLAANAAEITGFTVFDQSLAMIQSPQSQCPLAPAGDGTKPGGAINFYRMGSGARIAVQLDQAVAGALAGALSNVAVYWDYVNQKLLSAPGGTAIPVKLVGLDTQGNSKIVSYSSVTGFANWTETGFCAIIQI